MSWILKFGLRVAVNAAALVALANFFPGFGLDRQWKSILAAAAVLALVHMIVRPVLRFISFPFLIISLGLFHIVINFVLLLIADYLSPAITIADFKTRLIASIIIGIANSLF